MASDKHNHCPSIPLLPPTDSRLSTTDFRINQEQSKTQKQRMLARKGISAAATASSRSTMFSGIKHTDQSAALSFRISRLFSSQTPQQPTRVPRPIPLDIGNGPSASSFFESSSSTAAAAAAAASGSSSTAEAAAGGSFASRKNRGSSSVGSVFSRFGGPIFSVLVLSTATTLLVHLLYHNLALEEYKIASNKKVKELEAEIAMLKSNPVQHSLGGRGEFV
ncbi:hypothetical protein EDD21DRAFT_374471 [Dissophora ornata]|nr:hypothetical protein EDD21DRAFT_374471 [Dissophora ornata]